MAWLSLTFPLTLPFWTPWIFLALGVIFSIFGFFHSRAEARLALFYSLLSVGIALILWFAPFILLQ
jgi:hypothetical protein